MRSDRGFSVDEGSATVIDGVIRHRRTSMLVTGDSVPTALIEELCELGQWAPNHKRTWPVRYGVAIGDGRASLGNAIADVAEAAGEAPERVAKTRGKYLRTPATLIVGSVPGDSPLRTKENRDAAVASVQTILLAATARGLATYWGSCPEPAEAAVAQLVDFGDGASIVALIYLGWPSSTVEAPSRPAARVTIVNS